MRIRRIMTIVLIGILLMLAACGTPAPTTPAPPPATPPITLPEAPPAIPPVTPPATPPPPPPPPAPPPATPPAVQGPYDIWLPVGREFRPNILTVPVGTKVTWTNNDAEPHTVTSDTGLFDASL